MTKYHYGWSINISINPVDWMCWIIWLGDNRYIWRLNKPLKVFHDTPLQPGNSEKTVSPQQPQY